MFGTLLCMLGLHKRGVMWYKVPVWHHGEYPWDTWTHLCHSYMKGDCQRCGMPARRKRRKCSPPHYTGPRQVPGGYDWSDLPPENARLFGD